MAKPINNFMQVCAAEVPPIDDSCQVSAAGLIPTAAPAFRARINRLCLPAKAFALIVQSDSTLRTLPSPASPDFLFRQSRRRLEKALMENLCAWVARNYSHARTSNRQDPRRSLLQKTDYEIPRGHSSCRRQDECPLSASGYLESAVRALPDIQMQIGDTRHRFAATNVPGGVTQ